jgi:hypothetical protein
MAAAMTARLVDKDAVDDVNNVAKLMGLMAGAEAGLKQSRADAKMALEARHAMFAKVMVNGGLDLLSGLASKNPGTLPVGLALTFATPSIVEALPAAPLRELSVAENSVKEDASRLRQSIAQALITHGELQAPADQAWFDAGAINIRADSQRGSFEGWWSRRGRPATRYDDEAQLAFDDGRDEWAEPT